jgi:hypothetical protein
VCACVRVELEHRGQLLDVPEGVKLLPFREQHGLLPEMLGPSDAAGSPVLLPTHRKHQNHGTLPLVPLARLQAETPKSTTVST